MSDIANKESFIGLWSTSRLYYACFEDTAIAFNTDGTGFLRWAKIDLEVIDDFNWRIENDYIIVTGVKNIFLKMIN